MGPIPVIKAVMGGVPLSCLWDTGSNVSVITESFFKEHLEGMGKAALKECGWLSLRGANGVPMPFVGYLRLNVVIKDVVHSQCGILVVRDPIDSVTKMKRKLVPGILGMNIIKKCRERSSCPPGLPCEPTSAPGGFAKVLASAPVVVPAGSMCFVPATGFQDSNSTGHPVLVEALEVDEGTLPGNLIVSTAYVWMQEGELAVPVMNVGTTDLCLSPRTRIARIATADIVAGETETVMFEEVGPQEVEVSVCAQEAMLDIQKNKASNLHPFPFDFNCPHLSEPQLAQVKKMLDENSDVFAFKDSDLGCTSVLEHEIPLIDEAPVRQRYRRLPPSQYAEVKAHIKQLLEQGVIRESCSPYSSPLVIVRKKDGTLRMCVDYRLLNWKTRKDAYPLPRIEESLDALSGAKWFSTLDLASGYNQVVVAEKDRQKTAFCTLFGLYEFNRMPFGLCNAPGTFQRLMERIFSDQHFQSLLLYLDDVIVFSSSFDQHLIRLQMVLARFREHGLKVKWSKCSLFQHEVSYLGHIISTQGVATDPGKIRAVVEWQQPVNFKELRSFMGFAGYYRRFVEGFSRLAAPLHALSAIGSPKTQKSKGGVPPFNQLWSTECRTAFQALKQRLISAPVLAYADFTKPFFLEIDASHQGLGAVLSQDSDDGRRPVAYASRGLRPSERNMENYSAMKLEMLALKWAVTDKFHEYLLGHKFTVFTDNNPLSHLRTAKLGAIEQRWVSELARFDFDLQYRPGRQNGNADGLSRRYTENRGAMEGPGVLQSHEEVQTSLSVGVNQNQHVSLNGIGASSSFPVYSCDFLKAQQHADSAIQAFLKYWTQGRRPGPAERAGENHKTLELVRQWDKLEIEGGVLYRKLPHLPYTARPYKAGAASAQSAGGSP